MTPLDYLVLWVLGAVVSAAILGYFSEDMPTESRGLLALIWPITLFCYSVLWGLLGLSWISQRATGHPETVGLIALLIAFAGLALVLHFAEEIDNWQGFEEVFYEQR